MIRSAHNMQKTLHGKIISSHAVKSQVCQSCKRSVSRCIKCREDRTTCPNAASPHKTSKYQIHTTGLSRPSAFTTCMCRTTHAIPCNQYSHAHSILLFCKTFTLKQTSGPQVTCANSVSVPLNSHISTVMFSFK